VAADDGDRLSATPRHPAGPPPADPRAATRGP
jgi:hypothetical protein